MGGGLCACGLPGHVAVLSSHWLANQRVYIYYEFSSQPVIK